ncbi:MAG: ATP:cob(I)alamin adenosyltransferase, partial [Sphingomonas sp.]
MVKLNKIYTRTGDDGTTGLVDGSRMSKASALMQAIAEFASSTSPIA